MLTCAKLEQQLQPRQNPPPKLRGLRQPIPTCIEATIPKYACSDLWISCSDVVLLEIDNETLTLWRTNCRPTAGWAQVVFQTCDPLWSLWFSLWRGVAVHPYHHGRSLNFRPWHSNIIGFELSCSGSCWNRRFCCHRLSRRLQGARTRIGNITCRRRLTTGSKLGSTSKKRDGDRPLGIYTKNAGLDR